MRLRNLAWVSLLCLGSAVAQAAKPEPLPVPLAQELHVVLAPGYSSLVAPPMRRGSASEFLASDPRMIILLPIALPIAYAISSASERRAARRRTAIGDALPGYDFNSRFWDALQRRFPAELSPAPCFASVAPLPGLLTVTPSLAMSRDYELLQFDVSLVYAERELDRKQRLQERYQFTRDYGWHYRLPQRRGSGADMDAARWGELDEARLTALLDNAVDQVVAMINYDFSAASRADVAALAVSSRRWHDRGRDQAGAVVTRGGNEDHQWMVGTATVDADLPPAAAD
jgi:hypothetical protein